MFYPAAWRYRYGVYAAAQNVVSDGELLVALKDRPENPFVDNKIFKGQQALVWKDPDSAMYFFKTPRGLIEMEDRQVIAVFGRVNWKAEVKNGYA